MKISKRGKVRLPDTHHVKDGEWFQVTRRNQEILCCDCGLAHVLEFRIVGNRIQIRGRRHPELTADTRKRMGVTFAKT